MFDYEQRKSYEYKYELHAKRAPFTLRIRKSFLFRYFEQNDVCTVFVGVALARCVVNHMFEVF
jgi:hypothetical protein